MPHRIRATLALAPPLLLLLTLLLAGASAAAAKPRIAVVGLAVDETSAEVREKLDAAVAGGLAASGADVVDAVETARRIAARGMGDCETAACLAGIAQETGARYVVRGSVDVDGRSYVVRLEMLDGSTGSVIESREDRCEICTEGEAYETASVSASALKAAVSKRRASADAAAAAPAPASASPSPGPAGGLALAAPPPAVGTSAVAPATQERPARSRVLPLAGIAAGAVAIGAGVVLFSLDGDGTCSHAAGDLCERSYRTKGGGIALTSVGVVAAALGVTFLVGHF